MKVKDKAVFILILLFIGGIQSGLWIVLRSPIWLSLILIPFCVISIIYSLSLSTAVRRMVNLYRFLIILLGPFATLGCLLMVFLSPRRQLAEGYREYLASETVFDYSEQMDLGLKHHYWETGDALIMPYIDIMEGNDSLLKRNTINKVIQHPGPNSRIILDIGLNDNDPEIRFYSASALILLNDSFIQEFRKIQEKIDLEPTNVQYHFELASTYDRYCTWKLPEPEDLAGYFVKIERSYSSALKLNPKSLNAMIGLARVMIKQQKYSDTALILKKGLEINPDSAMLTLQLLKLLFKQKNYEQLKQLAKTYLERFPNVSLEILEAVAYWAETDRLHPDHGNYIS